jgi:hypothetical protein
MSRNLTTRDQLEAAVKHRDAAAETMFAAFIEMMTTDGRIEILLDRYVAEQSVTADA